MQEVKIYTAPPSDLSPPVQSESFCVDMVLASDYAELEEKFMALAAENAALKKSEAEFNEYCRHECEDVGDTWVDDFTETPATDAFLAEVRASGVDAAIEHLHKKFGGTGHIGVSVMALEWLAQEIRKGGAA
ncbi:hypothetical protein DK021_20800 [Salmonella enterica subsp. enterica serovar Javiana]|uniref:Ead/Ea22-like family protein n=1 Tax=Salmonella enterica subsp. enterica serovar Javiana TaxID=363569 RepID=A0A736H0P3_SALET|nr:hypothetical protein [Salmonella enterica subsp. enterica serovar Javiana]EAN0513159.1 hypothetical protein [Salmonella enterica]EBU8024910.1 hypothetical protein [Salmonella enterica subsp. enterica serovar Saintpaul]ECD2762872.1 hypothetical protein [Salmonella enterica subsp. enterica serovar Agona]ECE5832776.1 hypothetical protein [Salmonella enterica subsp. enterica]ECU5733241.1 hypothetical protein [Salmonella enterica subsp. enterica serovar 9,12:-:1,5]EDW6050328.1 hypothetical prot